SVHHSDGVDVQPVDQPEPEHVELVVRQRRHRLPECGAEVLAVLRLEELQFWIGGEEHRLVDRRLLLRGKLLATEVHRRPERRGAGGGTGGRSGPVPAYCPSLGPGPSPTGSRSRSCWMASAASGASHAFRSSSFSTRVRYSESNMAWASGFPRPHVKARNRSSTCTLERYASRLESRGPCLPRDAVKAGRS